MGGRNRNCNIKPIVIDIVWTVKEQSVIMVSGHKASNHIKFRKHNNKKAVRDILFFYICLIEQYDRCKLGVVIISCLIGAYLSLNEIGWIERSINRLTKKKMHVDSVDQSISLAVSFPCANETISFENLLNEAGWMKCDVLISSIFFFIFGFSKW